MHYLLKRLTPLPLGPSPPHLWNSTVDGSYRITIASQEIEYLNEYACLIDANSYPVWNPLYAAKTFYGVMGVDQTWLEWQQKWFTYKLLVLRFPVPVLAQIWPTEVQYLVVFLLNQADLVFQILLQTWHYVFDLAHELFYMDKTMMVFGDAKKVIEDMVKAVEAS